MKLFDSISEMGHEQLVACYDKSSGYRGIIAIHDTTLGPALGGTRFWNYASDEDAIRDVLRLARGMTYKNAVAGLNLGGGKAVIIGDNRTARREMIFRAHGRFVESLGGRYITAEDVGTSTSDMDFVHMETDYVSGLATRSGDPSPVTARGVFRAIQASARTRWGSDSVASRTIAVQGLGNVGFHLCRELHAADARLIVTDIDPGKVQRAVEELGARAVEADQIYAVPADIFAPCALGGILNDDTIPRLQAQIVAGAANNQLLEERHGDALEQRGCALATADAHRDDAPLLPRAVKPVEERGRELGASAAERVTERDGSAADVQLLVRNAELACAIHGLARERLVQLDHVDLIDLHVRAS